jgi:uncharacterized protein YbjT (DUF2867 family)
VSLDVVTGAFSYTGRAIAAELLARGRVVRTLSRAAAPDGDPLGGRVERAALQFRDSSALNETLRGADTLYNTYWVRFERGESTFARAVENIGILLQAARDAGVRRVVHVSVANPSEDSPLPYYRGKALAEQSVSDSGLSYAIVRPTLVFGQRDILVNNIAWTIRRFPFFAMAGRGDYRVQPVAVEDVATLCVDAGGRDTDETFDAAGPEIYTFSDLVRAVGTAVGRQPRIVYVPGGAMLALGRIVGVLTRDVVLNREELDGLRTGLLASHDPPLGRASFSEWLRDHGAGLGRRYVSELARNFRPYGSL